MTKDIIRDIARSGFIKFLKSNLKFLFFINLVLITNVVYSQEDYYFEDYVYQENIKSVKLYSGNNPLSYPISDLNGSPINLEFDDIDGDSKDYYYKILHCDMNWNLSELDENDFLEGFNEEEIRNSTNSSFTLIQYTHYELQLPNESTKWIISGNYLLIVYDDNEDVVITKRFLVVENKVSIYADINHSKDVSVYNSDQSLEIEINNKDYSIVDPLKELRVTVLQNNNWTNSIKNVNPKYLLGDIIKFDAFDPFSFKGLNEFRYFDTRSLHSTNLEIRSIEIKRSGVDVYLEEDLIRKYSNYFFHKDINGNFLFLNNDSRNSDITSQYTNVYFNLKTHAPILDQSVYVVGGFCDWQILEENKLTYDQELSAYLGKIVIKQGVIDYYYAIVDKDNIVNLSALEGSFFETQNDYTVLVYQRPFGGLYDKIIGLRIIE